jgi:hypothetical protein
MRHTLQDADIITSYVERSLQHQDVLLANLNLQAQPHFGENHLISKKEGVLVRFQIQDDAPRFIVRIGSSYWALISKLLANQSFAITEEVDDQFSAYEYVKIPAQYHLNCTKSVEFWRTWWKYRNRVRGQRFCMDLLVRVRHTWYPVKDLCVSNGMVYIRVLADEIVLHTDDLLFWLEKNEEPTTQTHPTRTRRVTTALYR